MDKLLQTLLEISIYSGIIFCVIMLLKKAFRQKISPILQSVIWLILVARLLIPITFDSGIKLIRIPDMRQEMIQNNIETQQADHNALSYENGVPNMAGAMPERTTAAGQNKPTDMQNSGADKQISFTLNLTWKQWAVVIWISGAAICAILLALSGIRLRRKLNMATRRTPAQIRSILLKCKAELGIRANIGVMVVPGIATPAMTISLFPKIIIPQKMVDGMDGREIYFALRHELTHFKRKDHLSCMLLMALQIIYWFNPFVWLAFREMRMDMESACDAMVVERMQPESKADYAKAIIRLSADQRPQYMIGMALHSSAKTVEKRIRGIYMTGKSKLSIKIISFWVASVIGVCCFTTACQPMPEKAIVANKSDGKLEETINSTSAPMELSNPNESGNKSIDVTMQNQGHWTETLRGNDAVVAIDADITVPSVDAFPVYRMQYHKFTEDDVKRIADIFFADAEQISNASIYSKEDWGSMIDDMQVRIEDVRTNSPEPDDERPMDEILAEMEDQLASYLIEYEKALPFSEMGSGEIDYSFKDSVYEKGAKEISIKAALPDGMIGTLKFTSYNGYNSDQVVAQFTNPSGLLSTNELREKAGRYFSEIGIDTVLNDAFEAADMTMTSVSYAKAVDGLPFYSTTAGSGAAGSAAMTEEELIAREAEYGPPISDERVQVFSAIQDQPVLTFVWVTPWDVVSVENENVAVISADEAKEVFTDNIFNNIYVDPNMKELGIGGDKVIEMKEMRLSYMYMKVKDDPNSYRGIPVWDFLGYEYYDGQDMSDDISKASSATVYTGERSAMLTVNAIDGSIVDRNLGY